MSAKNGKNIIFLILWNVILIALILIISNKSYGQYRKPPNFLSKLAKNWSVNANVGRTSFFGDVSLYDEEFNEKMTKEGSWAFGFSLARQLTPVFSISGDLIMGQLAGSNSRSQFSSKIREATVNISVNMVNLFIPDNNARFVPYAKFGMGQFTYDTRLVFDDPDKADITAASESPEFLYLFGGGAYYMISNSFNINLEMTGRRMDNDRIDGSANKNDDDYYSYFSLGVTYKINNVPRDTRYFKRMGMKSPLIRR